MRAANPGRGCRRNSGTHDPSGLSPAEVCGWATNPRRSRETISLRMVALERSRPERSTMAREDTGAPVAMWPSTRAPRMAALRSSSISAHDSSEPRLVSTLSVRVLTTPATPRLPGAARYTHPVPLRGHDACGNEGDRRPVSPAARPLPPQRSHRRCGAAEEHPFHLAPPHRHALPIGDRTLPARARSS